MDRKYRKWYNGILLYNKPIGCTSHDAVTSVRKVIGQRRVGHAGTLDPLAEGLLVMCIGRATKIVRFLIDCDKTYEAEIHLGKKSRTYDSEGLYQDQMPKLAPDMDDNELDELLSHYRGRIKQKVPVYSAVPVHGQRLYNSARKGIEVEPPVREVEIKELTLLDYQKPLLHVRVTCSSGTYIRSIAHDIGRRLGCGAYLSHLKRTAVGHLTLNSALSLPEIEQLHNSGRLEGQLLSFDRVLPYGAIKVTDRFKPYVISGKDIKPKDILELEGEFTVGDNIFLKDSSGQVLAIGTAEFNSTQQLETEKLEKLFSYTRVLN